MRGGSILLILFLLMQGCAGIRINRSLRAAPYDWLMYGGATSRVNQSGSSVTPPLAEVWEYNALAGIHGAPLVRDSVVLVVTLHGEIQAVNLANGERIGYMALESAVEGTPVWDGSNVYVASALGTETIACIGIRDAGRLWVGQYGPIESSPLVMGELLYVTTLDGILYCINKSDGIELWRLETREKEKRKPIRSSPASDGTVIVFGSDDGGIYAVERTSGKLRWKYQTEASVFAAPIVTREMCIVGSLDGFVYAIELNSGKLVWRYHTGSKIYGAAAATDSMVYVGSADGRLLALKINSGDRVWSFSARSVISSAPLIAGDLLYVGSMDRTLYALRSETGEKLWQYDAPGRVRVSPVIWGDLLLLTVEDKLLIALKPVQR
jgi:outer membrane protein assembly factor BamB